MNAAGNPPRGRFTFTGGPGSWECTTGVDPNEWLDAIEASPRTSDTDALVARMLLGVKTDLQPNEVDDAMFRLQFAGFLRPVSADGTEYTFEAAIPA